jgi:hypothetical protein
MSKMELRAPPPANASGFHVFIPGKMVEPIGIEPMTSSLQS